MGVTYLLDTHVLLWLLGQPERVPRDVRDQLANRESRLVVSSVSAMEVATKTRLGKLKDLGLVPAWLRRVAEIGAEPLALTTEHALAAGGMAWAHRDPFDRMLVAQAVLEGATLVSVDRAFTDLPAPRLLSW